MKPSSSFYIHVHRITRYLDSWPKIEKWYTKFGVLTTVDASQEMRTVYLEVEKILEDTLAKVNNIKNLINCRVLCIFIENEMKIINRD